MENSILNFLDFLKYAIELAYKPLEMWKKIELGDKQRLQNLLFPQGFYFDKKNRHIEPLTVNRFFVVNPEFSMTYENKKRGLSHENVRKSPFVLEGGLEPPQP